MATGQLLYNALNGVFCLYKPAGKSMGNIIRSLQLNLSKEMNKFPLRPMRTRIEVTDGLIPTISTVPDLADHPLAVGLRYTNEDFNIASLHSLDTFSSGVSILGINNGSRLIWPMKKAQFLKVYHVDGEFGKVSMDNKSTGKIAEQTTYRHVSGATIDRIVSSMQANHKRFMYIASHMDLQSQEAYEMACSGSVRPSNNNNEIVIYEMKMIYFKPPHFTLEIHTINESSDYLAKIIHNIGLEARSSAFCTKIRRIRFGRFDLNTSLLSKHATDPRLLAENIVLCRPLVESQNIIHFPVLMPNTSALLPPPSGNLE